MLTFRDLTASYCGAELLFRSVGPDEGWESCSAVFTL